MLYRHGIPGRILANVLRYIVALIRDMFAGGLMMRSMSLVYTTLLSIVPLLAFSAAALKGFGGEENLEPMVFWLFEAMGAQGAEIAQMLIDLVKT